MSRFDARSSSGTTARRYLRRGALALAAGAGAAALLAGCSSGQLAETSEIRAAVQGANASSANGTIELRNLIVQAPTGDTTGYSAGSTAPLVVYIANSGSDDDTLTSVTSSAGRVVLVGSSASPSASPSKASASPSKASRSPRKRSASPSGSATPSGSASATGSASPSESASPSASPTPAGTSSYELTVPAAESTLLRAGADGSGEYLALASLKRTLRPGESVRLVFHFEHAGSVTIKVPLNGPTAVASRSSAGGDEGE